MSENEIKSILLGLNSSDDAVVIKSIDDARNKGNISLMPKLIDLMLNHQNPSVKGLSKKLVFDTKVEDGLNIIIKHLKTVQNQDHQAVLMAALWEAGFDCTDNIEEIVQIGIEGNYQTLLEVYSVVDNIATELPYDVVTDLNLSINEWMEDHPESEKVPLLQSLCLIMNELIGN